DRASQGTPSSERSDATAPSETATASPQTLRAGASMNRSAAARAPSDDELTRYPWLRSDAEVRSLEDVFAPPDGFARAAVADGSFGAFLRGLPLRPEGAEVRAYDGRLLRASDDPRVAAVAELDVSKSDVQQCADSVIRLHAEWKWSRGEQ